MRSAATRSDERLAIPTEARSFQGFRLWAHSDEFPEQGRIDYLLGEVEADMSPEELFSHGAAKAEVAAELQLLVARRNLGNVFIDRTRVSAPAAGLSVEPDVVVVLLESLRRGRVRVVPAAKRSGRFVELEGAPDLVVEVVSDGSVHKDRERLPPLYAAAGVPELWLVDAREEIRFDICTLAGSRYSVVAPGADGWIPSPLLGLSFRLERRPLEPDLWSYRLRHVPVPAP